MRNIISNFFYRLKRRLRRILLEESDDPQAPAEFRSKPRRQLHNTFLIQSWAAATGIVSIAIIPVIVWLIMVPYFVIGYLVWCTVTAVLWGWFKFKVKKLNEQDYNKTSKTAADVISENA